jgi:hypothetical protein
MKKKILSVLLALALVLIGTAGMTANTVAAQTEYFSEPALYNAGGSYYTIGGAQHTVTWNGDGTYVTSWNLSAFGGDASSGGYTGDWTGTQKVTQNYGSWLYCKSTSTFDVYYEGNKVGTVTVIIETGHGADGTSYWVIS